ncbi:hypothetical protein jhhlp_004788 [Lomentospora prolificans]|uniref:cellulose 1,4-beta-cellobiosidase (non-reducing end) n=1 Tax=Lomentospora prolificans TaxID=41688 RepID=A0A2N3N8I1_9PEZI|nr:hypothetical protein jhhlp_004788 [Lomentospora prolificans]
MEGFPSSSGLDPDYCESLFGNFDENNYFAHLGQFSRLNEVLTQPMVLTMSISDDHWAHNLWLDSIFPPDYPDAPGVVRGECDVESGDPSTLQHSAAAA